MSYFGKNFRRTGGSNLDEFFKISNVSEKYKKVLTSNAPTWAFNKLDEQTVQLKVKADDFHMCQTFTLGVEKDLMRVDGAKMGTMTVTLEGDNVLKQTFRKPNGMAVILRREFYARTATMTITLDGNDVRKAHIFYEMVD